MKILFIINPISGFGLGKEVPGRLRRLKMYREVDYMCRFTEYGGHATEIVRQAREEDFTHIVAVGGDGTVNEVGCELKGTDIAFGVVSLGSGNGFARHLGFSMQINKALKQLLTSPVTSIDMIEINGRYSLNVSGIGFDAEVAHFFSKMKLRGIFSYIYSIIRLWFFYPEKTYRFRVGDTYWEERCFIVSIANSSQYGFNASIAPKASIKDGLFDICILKRPKYYQIPRFLYCFGSSKLGMLKYFREIQCSEAVIEGEVSVAHIDGDPYYLESPLHIRNLPGVLRVVYPRLLKGKITQL